jgi:hypothetical protein
VPGVEQDVSFGAQNGAPPVVQSDIDSALGEANLEKALLAALTAHSGGQLDQAVEIYTSILRLRIPDAIRSLVYNHRGMAFFALADYPRRSAIFPAPSITIRKTSAVTTTGR